MKWLEKNFELVILAIMLIVMSCLSFTNVIMRYCFRSALSWSDEICCYCLALSAFFSLPCAIRMGVSIKVDTLLVLLPEPVQRIVTMICNALMIFFLIVLLRGNFEMVSNAAKIGQASPALRIPLAWLYGAMAFAIALAILRYLQDLICSFRNKITETEAERV
ncbi:MAG: TRAP transporter small permease [Lachnospiraceae bacterium]